MSSSKDNLPPIIFNIECSNTRKNNFTIRMLFSPILSGLNHLISENLFSSVELSNYQIHYKSTLDKIFARCCQMATQSRKGLIKRLIEKENKKFKTRVLFKFLFC